jgi:hypothetical protein
MLRCIKGYTQTTLGVCLDCDGEVPSVGSTHSSRIVGAPCPIVCKHRSYISSNDGFAVGAYNPFEAALRWNSLAFAAYGTIGSETLDFVARRINEDFALVNRLAHCRGHDEVVAAYTDFWRKAAEDYGKEAATMGKLVTNAAAKMVVAGQSAMDEDRRHPFRCVKPAE